VERVRVSVLIPCYQQGAMLGEAVQSALAQDGGGCEVLIVNDGSTDGTREVAERLAIQHPGRVRVIHQDNRGLSGARQAGFEAAGGEYIVCLDADDLLEPGAVAACLRGFEGRPDADAVVGDALLVAEDGWTVLDEFHQSRPWDGDLNPAGDWPPQWPEQVLRSNPFGAGMAVMARASSIRRVGGLAVPGLKTCEDWDLWARMIRCGMRFVPVHRFLGRYRQRRDSLGRDPRRLLRDKLEILAQAADEDRRLMHPELSAAPAIGSRAHSRLANEHVFYSLGMAAALEGRAVDVSPILGHLRPGMIDVAGAGEQFLWGWQYAQLPERRPRRLGAGLVRKAILPRLERRLQEADLTGHWPALEVELLRLAGGRCVWAGAIRSRLLGT